MSAKEMFKKLEYTFREDNDAIYWEYKIYISETNVIEFHKKTKVISNYIQYDSPFTPISPYPLNMEELQAINQQCKELGWLD